MDSSTEILFSISQIISVFTTLIVLIAAIILFTKLKTLATWLILIGSLLTTLSYIGGVLFNVFGSKNSMDMLITAQAISSIIQNLSYLIFAVGLIVLAISEFSQSKS